MYVWRLPVRVLSSAQNVSEGMWKLARQIASEVLKEGYTV